MAVGSEGPPEEGPPEVNIEREKVHRVKEVHYLRVESTKVLEAWNAVEL